MRIYIPKIQPPTDAERKALFILTRPFYKNGQWVNDSEVLARWGVSAAFQYTDQIDQADVFFIPHPLNRYTRKQLATFNQLCSLHQLRGFGYISGDWGEAYPTFPQLTYFRMGGFKSQLNNHYQGFPVILADQLQGIYGQQEITVRTKQPLPVVGFCGHSDKSGIKKLKENLKYVKENLRRFIKNPFRSDYEPFFPSAFERAQLLQSLEKSPAIQTQFIPRKKYRAGARSAADRHRTTREYFDNIYNSDYVLCVRGAGNFSVRLYETLMLGRIPILVDTDCLLPFENHIDWKKFVVWVPWEQRNQIATLVSSFHQKLSPEEFEQWQRNGRELWKEKLSVSQLLIYLAQDVTH